MSPRARSGLVLLGLVGALGLGCGSTTTYRVMLGPAGPVARGPGRVRLTRDARIPGFRITEVALVQAVGRGAHADLAHLAEALEAEALSLGCDAVIRLRHDQGAQQAVAIGVAVRAEPGVEPAEPAPGGPRAAPWTWPASPAPTPALPAEPDGLSAPPASPSRGLQAPWQR